MPNENEYPVRVAIGGGLILETNDTGETRNARGSHGGSRKPFSVPRRFWAVAILFAVLFPALWIFQIVRSLHYEIVRDPVAWECASCGMRPQAKLRSFVGYPQGSPGSGPYQEKAKASAGKPYLRAWCHDLQNTGMVGTGGFKVRIGGRAYSGSCGQSKDLVSETPGLDGMETGGRFVYFIFLPKLKSDVAWANAEIRPNLILIDWADPGGFFAHSFSVKDLVSAFALAVAIVFSFRYVAGNFRRITDLGPAQNPGIRFYSKLAAAGALLCIIYALPWFHNLVILYFGCVGLGLIAFRRIFLWDGVGENSGAPPIPRAYRIALLLMLAAAFGLRAYKADWGFPLLLHTDEYAITSFPPQMAASNSIDPIDYEHPNHASIYLSSVLYGFASHARFHAPLQDTFAAHQAFYHWLTRLSVAVLGALCVYLAFLIGAVFHPRFGLMAALLFTLFPQFILNSHYATPDISLTLSLLGVILFSLRYVRFPTLANLVYASGCAAVATAEKYPGILTLAALGTALVLVHRDDRERLKLIAARAGFAFIAALFLTTPYLVLKPHLVLLNLISESRPTHPGHDGLGFIGNLAYYIHTYAASTSLILALFAVAGTIGLFRLHGREALPMALGFLYWIILSALPLHWERWDLPMVVSPLFLAAFGMHWLWDLAAGRGGQPAWLQKRVGQGVGKWFGKWLVKWLVKGTKVGLAALMAVAMANLLLKDLAVLAGFEAKDTRITGLDRLNSLGITESNSLVGNYTPLSPNWQRGFDFIHAYGDKEAMQGKRYAVVSSDLYDRYFNEPAKYPMECAFYRNLFTRPKVLDLKADPMKERFEGFNDFGNLALAMPTLRTYARSRGSYSTGPEITVYGLPASEE